MNYKIIEINKDNLKEYPNCICFINPKNEYYNLKIDWIKERFKEGLKIKLLFLENEKKPSCFIEYINGENAWRTVSAKNYLFIHCIWTNPNKNKNKGLASVLIEDCFNDAKNNKKDGVAIIVSDGAFMAKKDLFIKNGFEIIEQKNHFYLLVKKINKNSSNLAINNNEKELEKYQGLNILYSKQCPWVARFIYEVEDLIKKYKINIIEIKNPKEAQKNPNIYGTFTFINNGKILSDRYISRTRFINILTKEIK